MWILQLNPMTANAERVQPVAWSETEEALKTFLDNEKTEPYREGGWHKQFKKNGPLEMFNPPSQNGESWINVPAIIDVGTLEDWLIETEQRFNNLRSGLINT